jgi:hypothetical protein
MSRAPRRTARRRNPDPPPTLGEQVLLQPFLDVFVRDGAVLEGYKDTYGVRYPGKGVTFDVWLDPHNVLLVTIEWGVSDANVQHIGDLLFVAGNAVGVVIVVDVSPTAVRSPRFIAPQIDYTMRVFVPSPTKNKAAVARACYALREYAYMGGSLEKYEADQAVVARALAESQPLLSGVPRTYRKQIVALLQQAFASNDLATYFQARELAAVVSE